MASKAKLAAVVGVLCEAFGRKPTAATFTAYEIACGDVSDEQLDAAGHAALRRTGSFMPTPGSYYDMLPGRIEKNGIGAIDEDLAVLRDLEILVDGDHHHAYMLQIFLKEAAGLYNDPKASPFFYEIIQRKGDRGFGAGNFRALFESIEREQQKAAP